MDEITGISAAAIWLWITVTELWHLGLHRRASSGAGRRLDLLTLIGVQVVPLALLIDAGRLDSWLGVGLVLLVCGLVVIGVFLEGRRLRDPDSTQ